MMLPADRIKSFEYIGNLLRRFGEKSDDTDLLQLSEACDRAVAKNPWFSKEMTRIALNNLGYALSTPNLLQWTSPFLNRLPAATGEKTIGVVMAGNIPAVGFHDFLCVLTCGYNLTAKLSSSDDQLLPAIADILIRHNPEWEKLIRFTTGKLDHFDAIIATGNTNTSKYFEYYFGRYPHIIRKNRNSLALITGNETDRELEGLADDILLFFGLGCRSVSKLLVPSGYSFDRLMKALERYQHFFNHHKYRNNYDYAKSVMMVGQIPFIDTGFLLLREDPALASGVSLLQYEYYQSIPDAERKIQDISDSLQCVICCKKINIKTLTPGTSQHPALWDYADQVDTMEFLLSLKG